MKTDQPQAEKVFQKDIKAYEKLSAKTKELVALKDEAEKTTGPENVAINDQIKAKA